MLASFLDLKNPSLLKINLWILLTCQLVCFSSKRTCEKQNLTISVMFLVMESKEREKKLVNCFKASKHSQYFWKTSDIRGGRGGMALPVMKRKKTNKLKIKLNWWYNDYNNDLYHKVIFHLTSPVLDDLLLKWQNFHIYIQLLHETWSEAPASCASLWIAQWLSWLCLRCWSETRSLS